MVAFNIIDYDTNSKDYKLGTKTIITVKKCSSSTDLSKTSSQDVSCLTAAVWSEITHKKSLTERYIRLFEWTFSHLTFNEHCCSQTEDQTYSLEYSQLLVKPVGCISHSLVTLPCFPHDWRSDQFCSSLHNQHPWINHVSHYSLRWANDTQIFQTCQLSM